MLPGLSPFPDLIAGRVRLRQLTLGDEQEVFLLRSDEEVNRYLDRPRANNIEDVRQYIQKIRSGIQEEKWLYWAICLRSDPRLIGTICLWNISRETFRAEIGYELLPEWQGKGIMREALPAVLKYGFSRLGLEEIEAVLAPENLRSLRLLEAHHFQKLLPEPNPVEGTVTYVLKRRAAKD
jgi:ribosomal-protein-alanine N-acetyltransferase